MNQHSEKECQKEVHIPHEIERRVKPESILIGYIGVSGAQRTQYDPAIICEHAGLCEIREYARIRIYGAQNLPLTLQVQVEC